MDSTGVTSGDRTLDFTLSWVRGSAAPVYTTLRIDFSTASLSYARGTDPDPMKNNYVTESVMDMYQSGRYYFAMWLDFSPVGVVTAQAIIGFPNGAEKVVTLTTEGTAVSPSGMGNIILRVGGMRVEAVQVSQLPKRPADLKEATQSGQWKRAASLDVPNIPMRVIPAVTGSAWEVITSIARATLSTAEFDGDGIFHWRNGSRWATAPEKPSLTVTSAREISSLTITEEIDACRNHCSVRWANWVNVKANKARTKKTAITGLSIPPGGSYEVSWIIGGDELDTSPPFTADESAPDCIRFVNADTDTANMVYGAVEVRITREVDRLVLNMHNRDDATVWLRPRNLGTPGVVLLTPSVDSGIGPSDHWAAAWNTNSQEIYGMQEYEHDPGGWVQDSKSAAAVASTLRTAGAFPFPLLGDVEILPDPRIQLGDVVRVVDSTGASLDTLAWVIGIRTSGTGGSVQQTLTLRSTSYNGTPIDAGLTPDPPVDPSVSL
ncbi:hypothetical protein [Streptomyces sp. NPDC058308]|uniref:hypothetical protein n=1 Tax=Streptomyces sp. NPDC058308 TaxID=3346440 RepID=UPI0036EE11DA